MGVSERSGLHGGKAPRESETGLGEIAGGFRTSMALELDFALLADFLVLAPGH